MKMSLAEVLPTVQKLSRADKLRLIELVAAELGRSEETGPLEGGQSYAIWSPYNAYQAAEVLLEMLKEGKRQP
jgi:hypothetical protein